MRNEANTDWEWVDRLCAGDVQTVPWSFASARVPFRSWAEIRYGLRQGFAGPDAARGFAESLVAGRDDPAALDLLTLDDDLDVVLRADELGSDSAAGDAPRRVWVPVVLDWIRSGGAEPGWEAVAAGPGRAGRIEALGSAWASLGYPDGLSFLVPWGRARPTGPFADLADALRRWLGRQPAATPDSWHPLAEAELEAWLREEFAALQAEREATAIEIDGLE